MLSIQSGFARHLLGACFLNIVFALAIACSTAHAEHVVRIADSDSRESLSRMTLESGVTYQRDYGGYIWLVGDDSALSALQSNRIQFESVADPYQIRFQQHRFDPLAQSEFTAPRTMDGQGLSLIQFRGPTLPEDLLALKAQQMEVLQFYPGFGYLVWADQAAVSQARSFSHVRAAVDFDTSLKIQPDLMRRGPFIENVNVHFYNNGDPGRFASQLDMPGVQLLDLWPAQPDQKLWNAVIRVDAAQLASLAALPEVIALSYLSPEPELEDESAAQVLAGNLDIDNIPFPGYPTWLGQVGLDGSGVIWATTDSGVWYGHGDYGSRIVGGINYPGCNLTNPGDDPTSGGHGTHVTGIYAGDGTAGFTDSDGFLYGHGMAPQVSVFAQNPICGSQNSWPPAGGWQVLSRDALAAGAIGSNNSWTSGEGTQHGYQATERTYDLMVLDGDFDTTVLEPFMVVFSAGNSGASGVTAPKEAKNVVVTGGTQTLRVSGNVDAIYSSSSRGPAVDGRVLPTIAAPGQSVSSTRRPNASQCATAIGGTNGQYSLCTGTSMAAPHASGALILLTEWWRDANAGANPSPAMGKALLINSATALSTSTPPNNDIGWGRIDLSAIVDTDAFFEFIDQDELLTASGQQYQMTVGVVDTAQPLKITLVWSDAPGAIGANPAMVNDLDLSVTNSGNSYLGNVFSNGVSTTGGSPDRLNNIEQVVIENPGSSATITVDAFQIAGSVLLDQPGVSTAQHFALVCQNCLEQPDFTLDLDPVEVGICVPDSVDIVVDVGSVLGFTDPVNLNVSALPSGTTGNFNNPVAVPPTTATLTLNLSAAVAPGSTTAVVSGSSTTGIKEASLELSAFNQVPAASVTQMPTDQAVNVDPEVMFSWSAVPQAGQYTLEVSTDASFTTLVQTVTTEQTEAVLILNTSSEYFWRVRVVNACGEQVSSVASFTTRPEPGDCPIGVSPEPVFFDDVEGGDNGWMQGAGGVGNTWARSQVDSASGSWSWHADAPDAISDQSLISPVLTLPGLSELPITLRFENRQVIEDNAGTACWDGAILEVSTDGGMNWTQLENTVLLSQPYTGTVGNFAQAPNPLAGLEAWCGDPSPWQENTVDLSDYAGEDIQLRFRVGTDGTVGREGWYIDDIRVESCRSIELFADGFES